MPRAGHPPRLQLPLVGVFLSTSPSRTATLDPDSIFNRVAKLRCDPGEVICDEGGNVLDETSPVVRRHCSLRWVIVALHCHAQSGTRLRVVPHLEVWRLRRSAAANRCSCGRQDCPYAQTAWRAGYRCRLAIPPLMRHVYPLSQRTPRTLLQDGRALAVPLTVHSDAK